jgi:hypothetical protein
MSEEAVIAPVPIRAATPVARGAVNDSITSQSIHSARVVRDARDAPSASERMRALAQKRWAKPAGDVLEDAAPRMQAISGAVTAIAAALEPLTAAERQRALDAVVVMMG